MSNVDANPALPVANNGPIGWIVLACRLIVGATFLYASLDKLAHPVAFAQSVHNYHLVPLALLHPFALLLPAVEATIGVALLVGFWRRGAALLGVVLSVMFLAALGSAIVRSLDISCGCFQTTGGHTVSVDLLLTDTLLLIACLLLLLAPTVGWGIADLRRRRSASI